MFLNQTIRSRNTGRIIMTILGALAIVFAWVWEVVITLLIVVASRRAPVHVSLVSLLSLAFFGYTAILVFSSLIFSLNALLMNPDLDLLLVSPRPVAAILGGRMVVQVIRLMLLGLLFTAPALIVLALATHNPLLPLGFALLYLLYPVHVVVIVSLLSLLLVRVIPAGRGREMLTVLGVLLALGINILNFLINPALRGPAAGPRGRFQVTIPDVPGAASPWFPPGWAGRAASAMLSGNWLNAAEWTLVLLSVSLLLFALGASLGGRLYLAGWIQAVRPRRRSLRQTAATRRQGSRLGVIGTVEAAIVIKDWRMRTRDLAQLIRVVMPVAFLFIIFVLRSPRVPGAVTQFGQGPVAAMIGVLPAWILLFSLAISLGLSAVSLEGKTIWIYAASPNTMLSLLEAKCWATALPTAALSGMVTIVAEAVIRPGWLWGLLTVIVAIALSASVTALMVGLGAVFARFDWTDTRRMTNPAAVFIGMAIFGIITIGTGVLFGIALALASAIGLPVVTTWLAAMLIAVGGTVAVAAISLLVGNQRLRGLELG